MQFYAQQFCLPKPMIHEYANYANRMICISDHEIKGLCLSFYLVPSLEVYDT